jgi:hypothetical protein
VIWQVSFAEDIVGIMVAYVTVQMAMVFSS